MLKLSLQFRLDCPNSYTDKNPFLQCDLRNGAICDGKYHEECRMNNDIFYALNTGDLFEKGSDKE